MHLIMMGPNEGERLGRVGRSGEPRGSAGPSEHVSDRLRGMIMMELACLDNDRKDRTVDAQIQSIELCTIFHL